MKKVQKGVHERLQVAGMKKGHKRDNAGNVTCCFRSFNTRTIESQLYIFFLLLRIQNLSYVMPSIVSFVTARLCTEYRLGLLLGLGVG